MRDAELTGASTRGERVLAIEDFYQTLGHILKPDEILTKIRVPQPPHHAAQAFVKYRLRESVDFAISSVASVVSMEDGICTDTRIVLGAVAPTPGKTPDLLVDLAFSDHALDPISEFGLCDRIYRVLHGLE